MLTTERCHLKRTSIDDTDDLISLYADTKIWRFLGGCQNQERIASGAESMIHPADQNIYWTVRRKDTNRFLGIISLGPHHNGADTEISYMFLSVHWGNGYASETTAEIIRYAFRNSALNRIVAETQSANAASCKLLKKLGFFKEQNVTRFGAEQIIWALETPPYASKI